MMNISLSKVQWSSSRKSYPHVVDVSLMKWKGKTLFYDGREVVLDDKRKNKVLAELFEGVDTPYGMNAL